MRNLDTVGCPSLFISRHWFLTLIQVTNYNGPSLTKLMQKYILIVTGFPSILIAVSITDSVGTMPSDEPVQ